MEDIIAKGVRISILKFKIPISLRHLSIPDAHEWHPHANVMIVEMSSSELGIAVDTRLKLEDVKALIQLLSAFRHNIQQLFIDGPIIELLVSQINRQQVNLLLDLLRRSRVCSGNSNCGSPTGSSGSSRGNGGGGGRGSVVSVSRPITDTSPYRPFFPQLRKLTITSKSNQLEHL